MNQILQSNEYDTLIKKIQRKRKFIIVFTIIAMLITIIACSPIQIVFLNKTLIDYKGINPIITALLVLLIFIVEIIAYAIVSSPLNTSMDVECDPQKHLILNKALNKQKNIDHIYATDLIYLGDFDTALTYANKMIETNKPAMMIPGLLNKARCQFFLGDFDSLKATVEQYKNTLNNMKNPHPKSKDIYNKILKTMNLLIAISEEDKQKVSDFGNVEAWNTSKATQGYINYLNGIVAYMSGYREEAIYRFMLVREFCKKTVFSDKSQQYLLKIKAEF